MTEKPEIFSKYDIRGKVPEEIDEKLVYSVGRALGKFYRGENVVIGRDHRTHSKTFHDNIAAALEDEGKEVTSLGLTTTDAVAVAASEEYDAGVMLTASHMPSVYGGIKPLNSQGRILKNQEMEQVKDLYVQKEAETTDPDKQEFLERYLKAAESRYREVIDSEPGKVVIDAGNGVGTLTAPELLERLGAEVEIVNGDLDPDFPGRDPEPGPENLERLQEKVKEVGADLGVALDGDADRAVFLDEKGDYMSGDETLAIIADAYSDKTDSVVASLNSSKVIEDQVDEIRLVPVGAVFTALECMDTEAGFGGQPNGHLMDPKFVPYDSGTFFAALMAGMANKKPLSVRREQLPQMERTSWDLETDSKHQVVETIRENGSDWIKRDEFDTLRLANSYGSAVVRPSGSEPVVRFRLESEDSIERLEESIRNLY